jgi:cell wall-associated NlpC family hydrolase
MPLINSKREAALAIMMAQLNDPYSWQGNSRLQDGGVDCSGALIFTFRELQMIGPKDDFASYELAEKYPEVDSLREGVLLFWMRGSRIGHVEMVLGYMEGEWWTIGASGGGSATDTIEEAQAADARVKMRPVVRGWVKAVDPFAPGKETT